MNSYTSWAIFLTLLGSLSWHYAGRPSLLARFSSQKSSEQNSQQPSGASTRKPRVKAKRAGSGENVLHETRPAAQPSSSGVNVSKKRKIATPQFSSSSNGHASGPGEIPKPSSSALEMDKDATNNEDFAREMAVARAGTQFAASGKPGMSKKERRAQKQGSLRPTNDNDSPSLSTGASSTTGGDADDDMSPVASPPLAASSTAASSKSGDVSDMLEPPRPGPSILRLTDPVNPVPSARPKPANKSFEPAETKKQRQQRIKREAHRAQVEEAEKERRRLMEKQIRGARMAEGTSVQSRTSAFKPPAGNAWFPSSSNPSTEAVKAPAAEPPSLLDTFEPKVGPTPSSARAVGPAPHTSIKGPDIFTEDSPDPIGVAKDTHRERSDEGLTASGRDEKDWANDLPVEEEQIRLIQDSEDSWTTVSKRDKKKNASRADGSREGGTSEANGVENRRANGVAPKTTASSGPALSINPNSYHQLGDSSLQDSDWAA